MLNRPHSITADVEIPDGGAEGVLLCQGTRGRRLLALHQGRQARTTSTTTSAASLFKVVSADPVPAGRHELRFEFEPTGEPDLPHGKGAPGRLQLYVDGELVGDTDAPVHDPVHPQPRRAHLRSEPRLAGHPRLPGPFRFTGTIHTVTVDVSGELINDPEAEVRVHMARQ